MKDASSILILFIPFIITFLIYLVYKGADPVVKKAMIKSSACIFAPFMLIMGFFIGKSAFQETSLDKALELKEKGTVSGIIKDVRLSKEYLSVTVTDAKIELNGQVFEKSKDVLAYVTLEGKYGNTTVCYNKEIISDEMEVADYLKPGSEVSIEGKLSSFSKPTNPGQFNQWSYRKSQGYAAKISSKKVFISERGETSFLSKMKCGIYGLRRSAYKAIEELFPERESGIIKAMLLADKGDMEEDTYLLFSDGGITHILAVSGLHISLFAGALLYLAGMLKMGFYPSIALTAVFLFSYGLLTGFPVSALRAITMTLIMLFGRLTGKSYDALTGAAITAFMILVKNPLMLYNPSFLLSFGAVAGIFLFQPIFSKLIKGCFGREYKWLKKESLSVKILIFIMEGICLSFSVTLMTLPIVLWFYFKVSVYAVLLNLVIVPLMTLLLILIAAAISLFYVVLPAARIIAGGPYFILTMYEKLCGISTSLPGNSVLFGRPEKAGIIIYYVILMAVYLLLYLYIKMYEKEKSRNDFEERNVEDKHKIRELNKAEKKAAGRELSIMKLLIPAGMVLMLVLFTVFGKPRVSDAKIAFLDVGQGDGSVILTKNLCITIDGGSTTETNIGKYRIKPYIMSNGRNAIDYAFISHSDTDHLSGILELIEDKSFKVKMIVLGDITEAEKDDNYQKLVRCAEENGTKVGFVSAGMLTLAQAISVIMGANIGTTATAWIMVLGGSFDMRIMVYTAFVIAIALIYSKKNVNIGEFIMGLSLMLLGLTTLKMNAADMHLDQNETIKSLLESLEGLGFGTYILFLLIGGLLTCAVQSSAAIMAITMTLCSTGVLDIYLGIALVLGENIGTTITSNIVAMSATPQAQRAARAHLIFNIFGVIWVLCIYKHFVNAVCGLVNCDPENVENPVILNTVLAAFHTAFNVCNVLILIWFIKPLEKIVTWMVPIKEGQDVEEESRLKYISAGLLSTAELSILEARKEINVFAIRCQRMYGLVRDLLHTENSDNFVKLYSRIEKYESITDNMEIEIADYLGKVSEGRLSAESKMGIQRMLREVSELESIGDSCFNIARTINRHRQYCKEDFTESQYDHIHNMMALVESAMTQMITVVGRMPGQHVDFNICYNIEHEINNYRTQLKNQNMDDINNKQYDYQIGVFYIDIISECEKLGDYIINVVQATRERRENNDFE